MIFDMVRTAKRTKMAVLKFDSIADMIESIRPERTVENLDDIDNNANPRRASFTGRKIDNWDHAYSLMQQPWEEGVAALDRMDKQLADAAMPEPKSRRRRSRFRDDDGDELDYDRLRSGQSYWRSTRRESLKGPSTLTVVIDVTASGYREALSLLWRGAAAIAMAKRLEEAGYRVELWACNRGNGGYVKGCDEEFISVCLKRPGDPLDTTALINAVSGWAFRTIWFRAHGIIGPVGPGISVPRKITDSDLDLITPDANRVLIDDVWSFAEAAAKARVVLGKLTQGQPA